MTTTESITSEPVETRAATGLRWGGAIGIALVAVVRCVLAFTPQIVFDVDPALDPTPFPGLGPAGSLFLDALLLAACGAALLGEAVSKRGVEWLLVVLALLPTPIIIWHGADAAGDLWRGSTWLAAAVACVVVAHLARDRTLRFLLLALLASVLVPILMRGVLQSSVSVGELTLAGSEHAETVAEFEANRHAFFADKGWEPDSAAARIYERRLRQPDPRGWFPTSNLFATVMAFGLVLSVGLAFGAVRDRLDKRWITLFVAAAAVAALALFGSHSKGAMLATAVGLAWLAGALGVARFRDGLLRYGGWLVLGLMGAALLAVMIRGVILPESFLGDRSLLFRWHYMSGAAQLFADQGFVGVGPDGFQVAYAGVRSPRSPEEVTTAHSVFADWLAMLGVAGLAWVMMIGVLMWRAATGTATSAPSAYVTARTTLGAAAAVAVLGLLPAIVVEAPALDSPAIELGRGLGVLGYVLAAVGLGLGLERVRGAVIHAALVAAVVTLVLHAQIEMTFFDPGTVTWAMCFVGLAGGAVAKSTSRWPGIVLAGVLLASAAWLSTARASRAAAAQSLMIEAARLMHPPADSAPMRALQRREAAGLLETAWRSYQPTEPRLVEGAVRQLVLASALTPMPRRLRLLDSAIALGEEGLGVHDTPTLHALVGEGWWLRASLTGATEDWQSAIHANFELVRLDPNGISAWRRMGDLLWEAGETEEIGAAYRRALEADAAFELDPLKQLSPRDRTQIETRMREAGGDRSSP